MNAQTRTRQIKAAERAAAKYAAARAARDAAIVAGRESGLTLRELASATGLAVESVRRVLAASEVTT